MFNFLSELHLLVLVKQVFSRIFNMAPHTALDCILQNLCSRWQRGIGRGGPEARSPRSPDLTPCDNLFLIQKRSLFTKNSNFASILRKL